MRRFWTAWGLAILLVIVAIAATAWVIAASETLPFLALATARVLCVIFSLIAFVGAFRLALLGTVSLRDVLAQNLAILIAMELDDLKRLIQDRAIALADASIVTKENLDPDLLRSSGALQFPAFFGDREEIRKLLGKATEHTLEQVLVSLQSYNEAVLEADLEAAEGSEAKRKVRLHLWRKISVVQDRIRQAAGVLAPFCRANA